MPVTAKSQSRSQYRSMVACSINLMKIEDSAPFVDSYPYNNAQLIPSQSTNRQAKSTNHRISNQTSSLITHSQAGFTLVEIVVVVVILSIFAGMISLSVGSSDARKNRAFYEHLTDSLSYVRLLSAERMQPMGLSLQTNKQGQVTPVIVTLSNPYISYQTQSLVPNNGDSTPKNAMELSADLSGMSGSGATESLPNPSWEPEPEVSLPEIPAGVSLSIQSLEASNTSGSGQTQSLQPWFSAQTVPQVLWFGTGQAAPATIEVRYDSRLVGEVITIMPDGSMTIGQGL